ncbi:putative phosphoribosylformylglycinamidine synthase 1 [Mycobacterium xenopi 4042]|uniref:Putative phosphoribosylformylglycinamidine synthase 1 n=1 Tax=Mycobacterium xenopi 4042 TaxID=1299334 RepID=X7ZW56_MYCXE|nr:putative phosphoribosylformylglycinamidine synthase 1 [Mycobacterium xenopi 4042]
MTARIGVITFPGTLDDVDAARAVRAVGAEPVSLWHADADLRVSMRSWCPAVSPTATTCGRRDRPVRPSDERSDRRRDSRAANPRYLQRFSSAM